MRYTPEYYRKAVSKLGLKKQGNHYFCPLHKGGKEKTPSLSINETIGTFHCFGCKEGGTITKLVQLLYQDSSLTLSSFLKDEITRDISHIFYVPDIIDNKPKEFNTINIQGTVTPLKDSPEAQAYLAKRGIPYRIGQIAKIGFLKEGYVNEAPWCNRVIIPVYNDKNNIINIEGRDVTFRSSYKCIYPIGATKPIYEWYLLDRNKPVYVQEGLIKTLVLRSDPFFANSTTIFGSYISDYQLDQLSEFSNVIVIKDNDEGGLDMVKFLKKELGNEKIKVMKIGTDKVKDVDEIPSKLGVSVKKWRESGGFTLEEQINF